MADDSVPTAPFLFNYALPNQKTIAQKRRARLYRYGLSEAAFKRMLAAQDGKCAICKKPERLKDRHSGLPRVLSIDHDHETGRVRGLLCDGCNVAIARLAEDAAAAEVAAAYLRRSSLSAKNHAPMVPAEAREPDRYTSVIGAKAEAPQMLDFAKETAAAEGLPSETHHLSAAQLQEEKVASGTARVYAAAWRGWEKWATLNERQALPALTADVADHLAELSRSRKAATISQRLAAIAFKHRVEGADFDARAQNIRATMRGIARTIGTRCEGKSATTIDEIRAMVGIIPDTLRGKRDKALILLGYAGAFRRSELVGLDIAHLDFARDGVIVLLDKSKTDQRGQGRLTAIVLGKRKATCPVRALKNWIGAAGIIEGPVFRPVERGVALSTRYYDRGVANAVKRWARKAGLDARKFAGHSLRSGHVTQASMNGVEDRDIMAQTGHQRLETMHGYIRRGKLFKNNSSAALGL